MWFLDSRDLIARYRTTAQVPPLGFDLRFSWQAAKAFLGGGHPYTDPNFNYPPSNLLFSWPLGLFRFGSLLRPILVAAIILMVLSVMMSAAAVGRRWWGLSAAIAVWLLNGGLPFPQVLILLNASILMAFALALFFLLASRDHWVSGAVVLGISLCIKPLLLPVLVVFLLGRRWWPLGISLGIPLGLNLVAFAVVPNVGQVWSRPGYLLSGAGAVFNPYNAAVKGVGAAHDWPVLLIIGLRIAAGAVALFVIWWAWHRLTSPTLRVITAGSAALLGAFLSGTLAEDHYMLMFVPLMMTVTARHSPLRFPLAWVGAAWIMYIWPLPVRWLGGNNVVAANSALEAIGMALVLITMATDLASRGRTVSFPHPRINPGSLEGH
jgi:arabinofuranan 3-O-arabinosyltransferase